MDQNTFFASASFVSDDENSTQLALKFEKSVRATIEQTLKEQFSKFSKLNRVDYDLRYKADSDECLVIKDYSDPDGTIDEFLSHCNGFKSGFLYKTDSLENCKALLFCIPGYARYILIQRFYKNLFAERAKFYSILDGSTFRNISDSAFCIASSLAAIYDTEEKSLIFKSVSQVRGALPKFADRYAPGADANMMQKFFSNPLFDQKSAQIVARKDSVKISRLVWLLCGENIDVEQGVERFVSIDQLLKMHCFDGEKIVFPTDVNRNTIILRTLLGDVFEEDGKVYLTNSKKELPPFE